jgi:hypothetical protein
MKEFEMSEDNKVREVPPPPKQAEGVIEERGIDAATAAAFVSAGAAVVNTGVTIFNAVQQNKPKDPPPPPTDSHSSGDAG